MMGLTDLTKLGLTHSLNNENRVWKGETAAEEQRVPSLFNTLSHSNSLKVAISVVMVTR